MHGLRQTISLRHIEADDSYWAFDLRDGGHYELNETAFLVLSKLAEGVDITTIAESMVARFDVDSSRATRDVEAALADLVDLGIVEREGES